MFLNKLQRFVVPSIAAAAVASLMTATIGMCQEKSRTKSASSPGASLTKAVLAKLDERIPMNFPEDTPLEDILKYVHQATSDPAKKAPLNRGIPIYVEPKGLREADLAMSSTTTINLTGVPLKRSLTRALSKLHLDYTVTDGLLIVSSQARIARERKPPAVIVGDDSEETKAVLAELEQPVPMSFLEETPFEDVVKYIQAASKKGTKDPSIQIDVEREGLKQAKCSMASTIRNIGFEGVPLKTSLRLVLEQLELAYIVKDGLVIVSSPERVKKLKAEPN
jgi:hypothetical protein